MKILWLTWKDMSNPLAGGAEVVGKELARRLVADEHEVIMLCGGFRGAKSREDHRDGYTIIRVGSRFTVYWQAYKYYKANLQGWADLVIDEVNTIPFFAKYYVREPNIVLVHQLCRRIWFYEMPLPFSLVGWLAEPLYMRSLSDRTVITVSESTKDDLLRYGFSAPNIHIIPEGLEMTVPKSLPPVPGKLSRPTVLSFGSLRAMKRTLHQLKAFEIARRQMPELRMIIAGDTSGRYGRKVLRAIANSPYAGDISCRGRVSQADKIKLMRQCWLVTSTSVKEGWGLIVSEANSQGTPAVAYNTDGLRDSIRDGKTGWLTDARPAALAVAMVALLQDRTQYNRMRRAAWQRSKPLTFDNAYHDFIGLIGGQAPRVLTAAMTEGRPHDS